MSDDSLDHHLHLSPDGSHIPCLDLTDGASSLNGGGAYYDDDNDIDDDDPGDHDDEDDGEGATSMNPGIKVVETGQEHTGRWTREEHNAFLSALQHYGKEWKMVAAKVKTRTVVQTRTHAQKYFQKLQKAISDKGGNASSIDMDFSPEVIKVKRKKVTKQRSQSTTVAAQLMANLSSHSTTIPGISVATTAAYQTPHGFSQSDIPLGPAFPFPFKPIRIVAPDPDESMRRNFPDPSPAACGKRKLAELAAARMLAGVANSPSDGVATPPPLDDAPLEYFRPNTMSLQIVNPETLGISYEERKTRKNISPTTPWDGQLKALVRYVCMTWLCLLYTIRYYLTSIPYVATVNKRITWMPTQSLPLRTSLRISFHQSLISTDTRMMIQFNFILFVDPELPTVAHPFTRPFVTWTW